MCGIIGAFNAKSNVAVDVIQFKQALQAIQHRGPDNTNFIHTSNLFLGHQRLSIIDLSEAAHQPLISSCKRYTIVFNGEIYNFKTLKEKHQLSTKTQSDTEVLVELYAKTGIAFVQEIQGIFAMAIYDSIENSLLLIRDRNGIKPLYYSIDQNNLYFASELKAFYGMCPTLTHRLSKSSIASFLHLGFVPGEHTIFENIQKLPVGAWLKIGPDGVQLQKYYTPDFTVQNHFDPKDLKRVVEKAITKQLVADVPIGSFLSGGIDSSLVTAIAQQQHSTKIKTFTIGFKDQEKNEAYFASKIAAYLGTEHHEYYLTEKDALNITEEAMNLFDEPFSDSSAIPVFLLSKITSQHVKVALAGDGGDELFLGYGAYHWAKRLSNKTLLHSRKLIRPLLGNAGMRNRRASWMFNFNSNDHLPSHIFSQEQYLFSANDLRQILTSAYTNTLYPLASINAKNRIQQQQYFDLLYYLPDDLLTKVDRTSMYHGLEVRVPLLDEEIEAYINGVAIEEKFKNGVLKYQLKELLSQYIPKELYERPKQGFSVPLAKWLKNDLRFLIDNYLNDETIEQWGIVKMDYVQQLKARFFKGEHILYNRLWTLMILHKWLNHHQTLINPVDPL